MIRKKKMNGFIVWSMYILKYYHRNLKNKQSKKLQLIKKKGIETTLNKLYYHRSCLSGGTIHRLLGSLGKIIPDDEPLKISTIFASISLSDALHCLEVTGGYDYKRELRLYTIFCARKIQHLIQDERHIKAIDITEDYINGNATKRELKLAYSFVKEAFDIRKKEKDVKRNYYEFNLGMFTLSDGIEELDSDDEISNSLDAVYYAVNATYQKKSSINSYIRTDYHTERVNYYTNGRYNIHTQKELLKIFKID